MTDMLPSLPVENTDLKSEVERLRAVNKIALMLGTTLDFDAFVEQLIESITDYVGCERVIILVPDDQDIMLQFGASNYRFPSPDKQMALENLKITLYQAGDGSIIYSWLKGESILISAADSETMAANFWLVETLGSPNFYTCPLNFDGQVIGLAIIDNVVSGTPLQQSHFEKIANCVAKRGDGFTKCPPAPQNGSRTGG